MSNKPAKETNSSFINEKEPDVYNVDIKNELLIFSNKRRYLLYAYPIEELMSINVKSSGGGKNNNNKPEIWIKTTPMENQQDMNLGRIELDFYEPLLTALLENRIDMTEKEKKEEKMEKEKKEESKDE